MNKLFLGDSYEILKTLADNSVDCVVTDPPYGLSKEPDMKELLDHWLNDKEYKHNSKGFMGKEWDSFVPSPLLWKEVYRVLKPGGYALVFAGTRTQDLMTLSLRLAQFSVIDVVQWVYNSGFPKNYDISKGIDKKFGAKREVMGEKRGQGNIPNDRGNWGLKSNEPIKITKPATELAQQFSGVGTQLKPSHEPCILVRKPLSEKNYVDNVLKWGTGGLNIDDCRIPYDKENENFGKEVFDYGDKEGGQWHQGKQKRSVPPEQGRFPSNTITTEMTELVEDKYYNIVPKELQKKASKKDRNSDWLGNEIGLEERESNSQKGFGGSAKCCLKCDKRIDSNCGCNAGYYQKEQEGLKGSKNNHPTVKPVALMEHLVKLVCPKIENPVVLDPFAGSGSTLAACKRLSVNYIGIELQEEYMEIIEARTHDKRIN